MTIIATTSNSFSQEFQNAEDIKKICLVNYVIGFVTSSPMEVIGKNAHPFYIWAKKNYGLGAIPKWNFHKIIVGKNGKVVDTFASFTKPNSKKFLDRIKLEIKN